MSALSLAVHIQNAQWTPVATAGKRSDSDSPSSSSSASSKKQRQEERVAEAVYKDYEMVFLEDMMEEPIYYHKGLRVASVPSEARLELWRAFTKARRLRKATQHGMVQLTPEVRADVDKLSAFERSALAVMAQIARDKTPPEIEDELCRLNTYMRNSVCNNENFWAYYMALQGEREQFDTHAVGLEYAKEKLSKERKMPDEFIYQDALHNTWGTAIFNPNTYAYEFLIPAEDTYVVPYSGSEEDFKRFAHKRIGLAIVSHAEQETSLERVAASAERLARLFPAYPFVLQTPYEHADIFLSIGDGLFLEKFFENLPDRNSRRNAMFFCLVNFEEYEITDDRGFRFFVNTNPNAGPLFEPRYEKLKFDANVEQALFNLYDYHKNVHDEFEDDAAIFILEDWTMRMIDYILVPIKFDNTHLAHFVDRLARHLATVLEDVEDEYSVIYIDGTQRLYEHSEHGIEQIKRYLLMIDKFVAAIKTILDVPFMQRNLELQ